MTILKYLFFLFIKPTQTIRHILEAPPSFKRIVIFLSLVGTLRGLLEGLLILLMVGQFTQVVSSLILLKSYLLNGTLFVFSNITTAYIRWVAFALMVYLFGRIIGGKGRFEEFLRLYGVILGIFMITILPNFAHPFFNLPMIKFNISNIYNPSMGIGQILTSIWLAFISYKAARLIHRLPKMESILIGLSLPLINIGILVLGAMILFNIPGLASLDERRIIFITTFTFVIFTIVATPILLWFGYKIDQRRGLS